VNGADFRDDDGTWCSWHTEDGRDEMEYSCAGCAEPRHPDRLDVEGLCGHCALARADFDDVAHWDRGL
jgi:hypothetical protein